MRSSGTPTTRSWPSLSSTPNSVFIGKGSGGEDAFTKSEPASSGLQEMVMMFPGLIRSKGSKPEFTPLLRVGGVGGSLPFGEVVEQSMMGIRGINPNRRHIPTNMEYNLAARIQGKPVEEARTGDEAKKKAEASPAEVKAIVIGDLDLIGEQFFEIRRRKIENLDFDNITFVLNCVDVLAGDDAYIPLRKRRAQHRTLTRLEKQASDFIARSQKESRQAEDDAKETLEKAPEVAQRQGRQDRSGQGSRRAEQADQACHRRADREHPIWRRESRDRGRQATQAPGKQAATMQQSIRAIENRVRYGAIIAAPLPALLLAAFIFGIRAGRENQGANPNRLA